MSETINTQVKFGFPPASHDPEYLKLVKYVLDNGVYKPNRTGIGTYSVFGYQMRFNLSDFTIPMLTTKKMFTRGTIVELLDLFVAGESNIQNIQQQNVRIWDEWADHAGNLGPVYGVQWRKWKKYKYAHTQYERPDPIDSGILASPITEYFVEDQPVDQLAELVHKLKTNPNDRRLIVSAWNVADLPDMALPPCHYLFQVYARPLSKQERVSEFLRITTSNPQDFIEATDSEQEQALTEADIPTYRLSMMLNQRSADVGLGVPFNIVQYSMLLRMLCEVTNMLPGEFIWNGGDVHIYENHVEQLREQLKNPFKPSPTLHFKRKVEDIDGFVLDDFVITGYTPGPLIKMDVAV